jgi:pyruvate formate lyase activating enzyme
MMNHEASFYQKTDNLSVCCQLCPHNCLIQSGKSGKCKVRKNINGELWANTYGRVSAMNLDPIEKKPLFHFFPGSQIFSIGSIGCNFQCSFCQNHDISQSSINEFNTQIISPIQVIEKALKYPANIGIAYTYNEPTVYFEFMYDTAILASKSNLKNVVVSNGFINNEPLEKLIDIIDGFNIDLKSFSGDFYSKISGGKIGPVLKNLKKISLSGKHLEITHLLITGLNDQVIEFQKLIDWISNELGPETILHISRYFPRFKQDSPLTSEGKLIEFYEVAKQKLIYTYLGNVNLPMGTDTNCSKCGRKVISRNGYSVNVDGVNSKGDCKICGNNIIKQ